MLFTRMLSLLTLIRVVSAAYDVVVANPDVLESAAHGLPGGITLRVYAPTSNDTFPVVWFASGYGAQSVDYSKLISQIVGKGYIFVGVDKNQSLPRYVKQGQDFHTVLDWGKQGLAPLMKTQNFTAIPDVLGRSAVMAQSEGNHIAAQALTDGCSVAKAFIMIDPVDGADPFRIIKFEDLIKPGAKVNFNIPALLVDNGLDPQKVNRFFPPCAPPSVSNDHFYNAWRGPIWNINATEYGHIDCTDDPAPGGECLTNPDTDKGMYRTMLADATDAFLRALFENRPDLFMLLEDVNQWKVNVILKHDLKGKEYSDVSPGCENFATEPFALV